MQNGRRGDSRDRPGSVRSQTNPEKGDKKKQGGSKTKKFSVISFIRCDKLYFLNL